MLAMDKVTKRFGPVLVLADVNVQFAPGEITALIGPNGAGKTTLLNIGTGIMEPDSGTVVIGENGGTARGPREFRQSGVVRTFQSPRVFRELTVLENVRFARVESLLDTLLGAVRHFRGVHGSAAWEGRNQAEKFLREFGLDSEGNTPCSELSYGQQRLVELALAFISPGSIYLFDEPSAGLASELRRAVANQLAILRSRNATVVIVDHDVEFVRTVADSIVFLDSGRVDAQGRATEVLEDPHIRGRLWGAWNR